MVWRVRCQIQGIGHEVERHRAIYAVVPAIGFDAAPEARCALASDVGDGALLDPPSPVVPPEGDRHGEVEGLEAFA